MIKTRLAIVTLAYLILAPNMNAQQTSQLIGVSRINNQNSPLVITEVTQSVTNMLASVVISNTTSHQIISYEIGWIPVVSSQCADRRSVGNAHVIPVRPEHVIVALGKQQLTSMTADPDYIINLGEQNHAVLSMIQVAIISVKFADGGSWERKQDGDVYDQATMDRDAEGMCSNGHILPTVGTCQSSHKRTGLQNAVWDSKVFSSQPNLQRIQIGGGHEECYAPASAPPTNCVNSANAQNCTDAGCPDIYSCSYQACFYCASSKPCRPPK